MTFMRMFCLVYFLVLMFAASLNYIPGVTDDSGLAFGIFFLDIYDDALHIASALWALISGLSSHRAARTFMILFGMAYLGDGVFGFFTGYGYLDLGIFTNVLAGLDFSIGRVLANVPHVGLGGLAIWIGIKNIGQQA